MKFLATHHHSTCRLDDEEASGCVCSLLSFIAFSGCLWNFSLSDLRTVPAWLISQTTVQKRKLIAIITGSVAWKRGKWYTYFKSTSFLYGMSFSLFLLIEIAFLFKSWSFTQIPLRFILSVSLYFPSCCTDTHILLTSSFEFCFHVLLFLSLYTVTYMHTFNIHTLIHFRLHPCSLSCSGAEHSSALIKAAYLQRCSSFSSNAA